MCLAKGGALIFILLNKDVLSTYYVKICAEFWGNSGSSGEEDRQGPSLKEQRHFITKEKYTGL